MIEKFSGILQFFQEVQREFSKVVWPTRSELIGATAVVLLLVLVFMVYLGIVDFIFSSLAARIF